MSRLENHAPVAMNVGDVVCLKSGGPKMTIVGLAPVEGTPSTSWWLCRWFETFGPVQQVRQEQFPELALKLEVEA